MSEDFVSKNQHSSHPVPQDEPHHRSSRCKFRFALKLILVPLAAIAVLLVLNYAYLHDANLKDHELDRLDGITSQSPVLVANVGSSHGEYGFNYEELQAEGVHCFNFGLPSQTYAYDYAIVQQYYENGDLAEGGVMFIPVSYFSFNDEVVTDADKDGLEARYYKILKPKYMPDYSLYKDITIHRMPILTAYEKIFTLFEDMATGNMEEVYTGARLDTPFSTCIDADLEVRGRFSASSSNNVVRIALLADAAESDSEAVYDANTDQSVIDRFTDVGQQRFERHFANKETFFLDERKQQLVDMITYLKAHNITPVLITTPYTDYYTKYISQEFLEVFRQYVTAIAIQNGVNYYDYSHDSRIINNLNYFGDPDHLNEAGSKYFTSLLTEEVPELKAVLGNE